MLCAADGVSGVARSGCTDHKSTRGAGVPGPIIPARLGVSMVSIYAGWGRLLHLSLPAFHVRGRCLSRMASAHRSRGLPGCPGVCTGEWLSPSWQVMFEVNAGLGRGHRSRGHWVLGCILDFYVFYWNKR